jgi:hypothetical protein
VTKKLSYILLIFICSKAFSQGFMRPGDWKKYRKEVFISMGSSHFLGDLGGRDREGKDYSPVDLDLGSTRTAFGAGFRYRVKRWFNVTGTFNYLILRGDDAETFEKFRSNRNLNFKTNLFELNALAEFGYTSARSGNRYSIKRTLTRRMHTRTWSLFAYTGLGGFYFNPKGRMPNGKYVKLYPLHTEGQGLPGGPKQYSRYQISIPIGAYYKITWSKTWSVAIDFCWRKTFTDYIDDVSGGYYDPVKLGAAYGPLAVQMADPNKGLIDGFSSPAADGTPAQRGDTNLDSYGTIQITVGYTIKTQKRKKARLRSKF